MAAEMVLLNIDQLRRRPVDRAPSRSSGGIFERWKKHSIYRIPAYMKDQNPKVYTPQLVSIGPYHHGASHLAAMEEHKARSLQQFLDRTNRIPFEAYRDALRPFIYELLESYQQLDEKWRVDTEKFLLLMVVDGSFLCEFLHGCSNGWDYDPKDPVFSFDALLNICPYIIPDVLMMENQIPLLVIERLIAVQTGQLNEKVGNYL